MSAALTAPAADAATWWLMAGFIALAFTPYAVYAAAVVAANVRGRPVPSFGEVMARLWPRAGQRKGTAVTLEEIAENTRRILELLGEARAATPAPEQAAAGPEPAAADTAQDAPGEQERRRRRSEEGDGPEHMGRSTAWADRRRSDRGRAARGTGYAGPEDGQTYEPGTGERGSDRGNAMPAEVAGALRRLHLNDRALPDVATLTRAYRDAAKRSHPDNGGGAEAFVAIKSAYDAVLREIGNARRV